MSSTPRCPCRGLGSRARAKARRISRRVIQGFGWSPSPPYGTRTFIPGMVVETAAFSTPFELQVAVSVGDRLIVTAARIRSYGAGPGCDAGTDRATRRHRPRTSSSLEALGLPARSAFRVVGLRTDLRLPTRLATRTF